MFWSIFEKLTTDFVNCIKTICQNTYQIIKKKAAKKRKRPCRRKVSASKKFVSGCDEVRPAFATSAKRDLSACLTIRQERNSSLCHNAKNNAISLSNRRSPLSAKTLDIAPLATPWFLRFGTENNLRAAFYTHAFAHRCSCLYKLNNCKRTNFPQLDKFS